MKFSFSKFPGHSEILLMKILSAITLCEGELCRRRDQPPESPIAIACFRLVTFLPDRPLLKVPLFRSRIALLTFCCAFLPYLALSAPSYF
jgi:hypothetical protein